MFFSLIKRFFDGALGVGVVVWGKGLYRDVGHLGLAYPVRIPLSPHLIFSINQIHFDFN
jgi:hypothetical protein